MLTLMLVLAKSDFAIGIHTNPVLATVVAASGHIMHVNVNTCKDRAVSGQHAYI